MGVDAQAESVRALKKAQIALTGQLHIIKTATINHQRHAARSHAAPVAELHVAAHIDQVGAGIKHRLTGTFRHARDQHRMPVLVFGQQRIEDSSEQYIRGCQIDPGVGGGVLTEAHGTAVQAQALAHVQRHITVKTQQAIGQHSQVVKTAGADLINPQTRMTVLQAGGCRIGRVG